MENEINRTTTYYNEIKGKKILKHGKDFGHAYYYYGKRISEKEWQMYENLKLILNPVKAGK